jgi:hypothetical protein
MHRILLAAVLACSGCLLPMVRADPAVIDWQPAPLDARSLEADLEGHGAWVDIPDLGRVWQPAVAYVGADFYPYGSGGRWMLTEAGWVFDSDYPFGWATFHYGRWVLEPAYGWVWVPGSAWAPSWVAWRAGGAFVGWAALGPGGEPPLGAARWTFIERGHLLSMNPHRGALPAGRFDEAASATAPLRPAAARQGPSPAFVTAGTRQVLTPRSMASVPSTGRAAPPTPSWRAGTPAPVFNEWPGEAAAAPAPATPPRIP